LPRRLTWTGLAYRAKNRSAVNVISEPSAAIHAGPRISSSALRVNAIEAGPTETPGTAATPGLTDRFAATIALGRVAAPDEIANAVVLLSSPAASYINGAVLQVTGGQLAIAA